MKKYLIGWWQSETEQGYGRLWNWKEIVIIGTDWKDALERFKIKCPSKTKQIQEKGHGAIITEQEEKS